MRQSRAREKDARLEAERKAKYQGAVRASLDLLQFRRNEARELDVSYMEKLKI